MLMTSQAAGMRRKSTQRERPVVLRRSTAMMIAATRPMSACRDCATTIPAAMSPNASRAHPLVQPTQSGLR